MKKNYSGDLESEVLNHPRTNQTRNFFHEFYNGFVQSIKIGERYMPPTSIAETIGRLGGITVFSLGIVGIAVAAHTYLK